MPIAACDTAVNLGPRMLRTGSAAIASLRLRQREFYPLTACPTPLGG